MPLPIAPVGPETYLKSLTAGMLQLNGVAVAAPKAAPGAAESFQAFLGQAIDQTVQLQKASGEKTTEFLTGSVDDLHQVMIAQEKASLAFQLTLQVRNKMVEAYQEVMRMQI